MDTLPKRFMDKVNFTSDCWLWIGVKNDGGYGQFSLNGKKIRSHRFVWEHFKGEIPKGMEVCHKCDVPNCVNPNHLFLGTHQDNMADKTAKGRNPHMSGEKNGSAKLSQSQVDEIRRLYRRQKRGKNGTIGEYTTRGLAEKFGVGKSQIIRILNQKSWLSNGQDNRYESRSS
jgi:hypothetical protein